MMNEKVILHIAIATPLHQYFDYLPADDIDLKKFKPGVRIRVPWRQAEAIGILVAISTQTKSHRYKLKKVLAVLDESPLFSPTVFSLLQFAAEYYHYPIGEVFAAALPALLRQGREAKYRQHYSPFEALPETTPLLALNDAQQSAVHAIIDKLNEFQAFLLFGVTGSGKTEVYLQIIAEVIQQQKQALVLVPEIGLTPQTVARFQQRFPVTIAVLHSGLTDRERHDAWLQACNGDAPIIIGTRSAIFTPLKNPGVIILDEEHDISFKQQEGFRYSARDLAIMRAQLEKVPVILGSATPSLESLHNVQLKRYLQINLPERAGSAVHPVFHLIDLRKQPIKHGLSVLLLEKMQQHLNNQGQVLLFLNRRGYAPTLICHACGWIAQCQRCDAKMTLHQQPLQLQCHHCGSCRKPDQHCPDCLATELFSLGAGTERIESALKEYFPKMPIIRIDRDTTRAKGSLEDKLATIHKGEPGILIGTQMLAKGHHFADVTLAVILNADSGLLSADFRGPERTAQLILQVAGRAGRVEKPGEVVLQTYHPDHALLRILLEKGYGAFAELVLAERQAASLPPYISYALIRAEAIKPEAALNFLQEVKIMAKPLLKSNMMLLGPLVAPMPKRAGKYRAQLLIQSSQRKPLQQCLQELILQLIVLKSQHRVRWSIDVDPQEMF